MRSLILKRSVNIAGHKTSISLEEPFWIGLKESAARRGLTIGELVGLVDANREHTNLSSALRLYVLDHYRAGHAERRAA
ncbi:Uncharacterised protein [Starkeya nomas]|uniref:Ribbon-helix-helix domain-containing protein n=1 Tax=Starkeya nomas TaxID=2666134 RepID=A0A5S9NYQ5_9HYPH|nr:ribbon-helix-helix domain-containing protein [Starkeya nomas]CAA0096030.1 Uncharacterised protein [Starkeya nomas]